MIQRPRRLRQHSHLRDLVREHRLHLDDFVYPMFVDQTLTSGATPIGAMPGIDRFSLPALLKELEQLAALGVNKLLLFGIPEHKDATGTQGYASDGIVQQALQAIRKNFGQQFYLITDVCNCEYTDHGHCGILDGDTVDNDKTLPLLQQAALSHAQAGADMVAPSDMMDGRVAAIREALDTHGYDHTPIMAYSAKFASSYYGPFREAADSTPQFGDRRAYQMDPANGREALKEVMIDLEEGADLVMVKPALSYLDLVWQIKQSVDVPVALYNVSGEYSMIKAAADKGWIDEKKVTLETLTSFKRAGADIIISYHTRQLAQWLQQA